MSVILQGQYVTLVDGATVATDASLGDAFYVSSGRLLRTIANPTNPTTGQLISYLIESVGAKPLTSWGTAFALAGPWTDPAQDRARAITFFYNGSAWVETNRTGADVRLITFDPSDVAGLVGWWDAGTLPPLADGDPVVVWTARAGPDLGIGVSPTYKTNIQNGLPVVRFDQPSSQYLKAANPLLGYQNVSIFAVYAKASASATYTGTVVDLNNAAGSDNVVVVFGNSSVANDEAWEVGDGVGTRLNCRPSSVGTAFHQWSFVAANGASPNLYKDAGSSIGPTPPGNTAFAAVTQAGVYVGATSPGTGNFNGGDLAELLVYSAALSGTDRASVATYLKNKWGTP